MPSVKMEHNTYDLISTRPYLVRAIRDWAIDNGLTPQLLVDAAVEGVKVPSEHVHDGRIVLNVDPGAVVDLHLGNDQIVFTTRFQGKSRQVLLPLSSVMAIFARENNQGFFFHDEHTQASQSNSSDAKIDAERESGKTSNRPHLKLVE
jgi:stringent starvation protein B